MSQASIGPVFPNLDYQPAAPASEDSPVKSRWGFLRLLNMKWLASWRCLARFEGACDREQVEYIGPLGRLHAEDVRWDLIGASGTGRRYRI